MATLAQQYTGLRCHQSHTHASKKENRLPKSLYIPEKNKMIVLVVAISNAHTRKREELKQLFEEAYERCRTAPTEDVSFTLEEFQYALDKYDFNSELECPKIVEKFTTQCQNEYYDNLIFHRDHQRLHGLDRRPFGTWEITLVGNLSGEENLRTSFKRGY